MAVTAWQGPGLRSDQIRSGWNFPGGSLSWEWHSAGDGGELTLGPNSPFLLDFWVLRTGGWKDMFLSRPQSSLAGDSFWTEEWQGKTFPL